MTQRGPSSPYGLHRVITPIGVLPQYAHRLEPAPQPWPDEVIIDVTRLNVDAASYRQLRESYTEPAHLRAAVLDIVRDRGKLHNPVTGSGGMLLGTVREVGPQSPLPVQPGDQIASLVSLTLTPLLLTDDLRNWSGDSAQIPCQGTAVLFGRSSIAQLPDDLPEWLSLAVFDVCGAPALTSRIIDRKNKEKNGMPSLCVLGGAGKSGSLSLAAARRAGVQRRVAVVPNQTEADLLAATDLATEIVLADGRNPLAVAEAVGEPVDITVVCVDVAGCEHGAIMATAPGGTVVFFGMATSFSAAALGAEGLVADVEMLIGNGFVPGHADYALELTRAEPGVRALFQAKERQTSTM